jgi:hypothetical protein
VGQGSGRRALRHGSADPKRQPKGASIERAALFFTEEGGRPRKGSRLTFRRQRHGTFYSRRRRKQTRRRPGRPWGEFSPFVDGHAATVESRYAAIRWRGRQSSVLFALSGAPSRTRENPRARFRDRASGPVVLMPDRVDTDFLLNWLDLPGCPPLWVVWFLQLVSNFVQPFWSRFPGAGGCVCFSSTEPR